ncbi:excisionase family DNA binding protein [Agromyces sp. 3263]|jgi:excisionase family DNA binding protein|uniref:helix-turn-helix domain-containing protein n=1 Tax=Agromyces sp. 3263 TaxID=2817750 RepID=UPI0028648114|nr:helix-turn-helix domain-containing protein [Agromyces sp. 3263]MDR6904599.1 excisionase family DNA binding protein [Agromyces sp. 3263]
MTTPGSGDEIGRFLTVADAAELLAVDVATVDELIRSGELPAIRVGTSGPWRVERTQLELWIDDQYEATRRHSLWNQGEFANVTELSGARTARLRPVD